MTLDDAKSEATLLADDEHLVMAVYFDPYGEEEKLDDRYGYMPLTALSIFQYHELIETIHPAGVVAS